MDASKFQNSKDRDILYTKEVIIKRKNMLFWQLFQNAGFWNSCLGSGAGSKTRPKGGRVLEPAQVVKNRESLFSGKARRAPSLTCKTVLD
jgi:hypothetical protein